MEFRMTFFSGKGGESLVTYVMDLVIVFMLSLLVERLSHTKFLKASSKNKVRDGLIQTGLYTIRMATAYLVMLAVMSFNTGIYLAAIAGYSVGFLVFGSRVFYDEDMGSYHKPSDLPPLNC